MERLQKAARIRHRRVIGLNSGTSADGLDLVLLEVRGAGWASKIRSLRFRTMPFPSDLKKQLDALLHQLTDRSARRPPHPEEILQLDLALGRFFGRSARTMARWARRNSTPAHLVASHGQTIWHSPRGRRGRSATLQLGHPPSIAALAGLPVVADFRQADIAAGGQGAPLTPALDYLLFRDRPGGTAALNLGGITNLTVIPNGGGAEDVSGYDIGPCNLLLDGLCRRLADRPYDRGGELALAGQVNAKAVAEFLNHPYYQRPLPRSTGREEFGPEFLRRFIQIGGRRRPPADHLATAVALVARSIAEALENSLRSINCARLVISGGGARNRSLRTALARETERLGLKPELFHECGLTIDSKEAGLFAWLGSEAVCGRRAHLPRVTGADSAQILGVCIP
jgi:anhydro-N-acetylmuramic acid kinase